MKLSFREIEPFVKTPNKAARVILVYGPDSGLVSERCTVIGKSIVPDLNDPFNVCILTAQQLADDPALLSDEAFAISMMGGDRLVRIQDASDKITGLLKSYLENPSSSALVLVQAGELGTKSSLRGLCEKASNAAAVPCYVEDEKDLTRFIQDTIRTENKNIERDALAWLAANISGDRVKVRSELEKLLVYKGMESSAITLEDAQAACGVAGAQGFDNLVYAVAGRNAMAALKAYGVLLEEGESVVAILRILQNHFRRLHVTKAHMMNGDSIEAAMRNLSPPVFFKQEQQFKSQLGSWTLPMLDQILGRLTDLEAQCKQTAMPVETLCSQAILSISKMRVAA